MMLRKHTAGLALLAVAAALPSQAADRPSYAAVLGHAVIPDGERDSNEGYGFRLVYGIPFNEVSDIEINAGSHLLNRESDQQFDSFYNLGIDLKLNFPHNEGDAAPFLIGGFGAAREDEFTEQEIRPYADIGFGFVTPLPISNISLRAESRYHLVYAGNDAADRTFGDVLFNVGVQFAFDNRGGAVRDSDSDGVVDGRDRCPKTPAGAEVDGRGCPVESLDSDGDGVTDVNDRCPGTPPGTAVDAVGCPVQIAAIVVPAPSVEVDNDSDDDGVPNASDACPGTAKGLAVDATGCVIAQTTVLQDVQFETNSSRLTPRAVEILTAVAGSLKTQPGLKLEISGHTDSLGPQSTNLTLSLNRAKSVEDFLIKQGIASTRLQSEGYGEFIPVDTNETDEGRAKNRRVEFKVMVAAAP